MQTIVKISSVFVILGGVIALLLWFSNGQEEVEMLDLVSAKEQVKSDLEAVTQEEEKVYKWLSSSNVDVGYLDGHDAEVIAHYKQKKGVVEFLFAAVLMKDVDLFIQAFQPGVISSDLFMVDNVDKNEVALSLIDKISRDGKLSKVGYETEKGAFGAEGDKADVTLIYSDGLEVTVPLTFVSAGTHHEHGEDKIYSITTSAWDIVKVIERSK